MDLRMAVMTGSDTVVGLGGLDLLKLELSIFSPRLCVARLQISTATAAAVIIGSVRLHIDKIFLPDNSLDHKTQVFGDRITEAFANQLTRILNRKLDFQIFVPI